MKEDGYWLNYCIFVVLVAKCVWSTMPVRTGLRDGALFADVLDYDPSDCRGTEVVGWLGRPAAQRIEECDSFD